MRACVKAGCGCVTPELADGSDVGYAVALTSVKPDWQNGQARSMNCRAGALRFGADALAGEAMVWEPLAESNPSVDASELTTKAQT